MSPALLALLLAATPGTPAGAPRAAPPRGANARVHYAYDAPKDPAHRPLFEHLREKRMLEGFVEVLGAVRLPRDLTLAFAPCDGESNAWYDPDTRRVTFCYELVADLDRASAGAAAYGIGHQDALDGAVVYVMLHECGHALFDLLKVPVLGREEDAADQVAAFTLLRMGQGFARRVLSAAAWMYKHDASSRALDESDYADVHGLDTQRFYNVLCMAYGSDRAAFAGVVEKGYLPSDRADGCPDEFRQVSYAVRKLISGRLDPASVERTRARFKGK